MPEYTPYDTIPLLPQSAGVQTVDSAHNSNAPFTPSPFPVTTDSKGICAYDDQIDTFEEMVDFMRTHNTRPFVYVHCWGGHDEQRTRTVRDGDSTRQETYTVTVT